MFSYSKKKKKLIKNFKTFFSVCFTIISTLLIFILSRVIIKFISFIMTYDIHYTYYVHFFTKQLFR